jgi:hypothetical protein
VKYYNKSKAWIFTYFGSVSVQDISNYLFYIYIGKGGVDYEDGLETGKSKALLLGNWQN